MRYALVMFVMAVLASNAFCEETWFEKKNVAFSAAVGLMDGHSTYQIGGYVETPDSSGEVRFPLSELRYPLYAYYGGLSGKVNVTEKLKISAGLKKNISKDTGKMRDRDWGILYEDEDFDWWTDPDSLDVYSVSDTETDALLADISARFYFDPLRYQESELLIFFGWKYVYQKFEFTTSNLDQWNPSLNIHYGFDAGHVYVSGEVLTYELSEHFPAIVTGATLAAGPQWTLDLMLGYSPFVTIEDEDHHFLRSVVSKSECDGNVVLFSLTGDFSFFTRWSFGMKYDYTNINTEGQEKQYHDGEYAATLQQKNFSDLHMYELSLSYRF